MSTPLARSPAPIIDAQTYLASELVVPRAFLEYQAANAVQRMAAYGHRIGVDRMTDQLLALHQDDDGDRLVAELDAAGVDQAYLLAADYSQAAKCALSPPEMAELHARVLRRHPGRFHVFWGVDPRSGRDGVELFEHCVTEYGFAGLKLYPLCGYSPSDRGLYPYFEICAERGLPVLSHTGPGWGPLDFTFGDPLLIDRAAHDFPGVDFILGHGGVSNVDVATYLCGHRPNMYLDVSQFHATLSSDGWQKHLNRLFRCGIDHKILFGTCWPSYRMTHSLTELLADFAPDGAVFDGVAAPARRLIMGGTAARLVGAGSKPLSTSSDATGTETGHGR